MNIGTSLLAIVCLAVGLSIPWPIASIAFIAASIALAVVPVASGWRQKPAPSPPREMDSPDPTSRAIPMGQSSMSMWPQNNKSTEGQLPLF